MGYETVVRKSIFNLILGVRVGLRQFKEGVVYSDGKSATPPRPPPRAPELSLKPGPPARGIRGRSARRVNEFNSLIKTVIRLRSCEQMGSGVFLSLHQAHPAKQGLEA
jgi:hypothetical protein